MKAMVLKKCSGKKYIYIGENDIQNNDNVLPPKIIRNLS